MVTFPSMHSQQERILKICLKSPFCFTFGVCFYRKRKLYANRCFYCLGVCNITIASFNSSNSQQRCVRSFFLFYDRPYAFECRVGALYPNYSIKTSQHLIIRNVCSSSIHYFLLRFQVLELAYCKRFP